MRIISKEHDYYDRAMGHGQDDAACYVRQRAELSPTPAPVYELMRGITESFHYDPVETRHGYIVFAPFVVVFCGKLYRGIQAEYLIRRGGTVRGWNRENHCFYDWQHLASFIDKNKAALPKETHYRRKMPFDRHAKSFLAMQGTAELEAFVLDARIAILTCFEAHLRYWHNTDVVAYCYSRPEYRTTKDDTLGSLGFGHFFDAFSAFQELDMFISGTLGSASAAVLELSEKDRIAQHGFDKWSFRRPPPVNK